MNTYELDETMHRAAEGVIMELTITFDAKADKVHVNVAQRNDIKSEDLLNRVAQQVEHALRSKSAFYALEMQRIEELAGLTNATACGCQTCGK